MKFSSILYFFTTVCIAFSFMFMSSCNTSDNESAFNEYFVSASGSDSAKGTIDEPFLTINHAAKIAMPGDTITVKEGVYREWVNPVSGGLSEDLRITYRAASGEDVRILGSEEAKGWEKQDNGLWKIVLKDEFFKGQNPFKSLIRHPLPVGVDESGDGWGWLKYGRWAHLGDVIINGEGLTEKRTIGELPEGSLTWYTELTEDGLTIIWANFNELDPNAGNVELCTRGYAFFPEKPGLGYITLKGFIVMNVACHWAPPTVYQPGAIGPNGGHHWIIEDNIVMYAKGVGISVGIPKGEANLDSCGYHIIRNNVIMRCGQGGTAGQLWAQKSQIYNNHIEDINYREEFGGWETAGIKHHGIDSLIVRNNFIRGVYTKDPAQGAAHGIWNDFKNYNWRVSSNVTMKTESHGILAEANWEGPNLYEKNILIDGSIGSYSTCRDAWVHNMFIRSKHHWQNQTWDNRPKISHNRWMNNLFFTDGIAQDIEEDSVVYKRNFYFDGAKPYPGFESEIVSTNESKINVEENSNNVSISFIVADDLLDVDYPKVDNSLLGLSFSFETSIETDFYGETLSKKEIKAGPFKLKAGVNEFIVYQFSPLYKKALKLIRGK